MDVADVHGVCVFSNVRGGFECPFKLDPPTMPLASYFWICAKFFGISEEQTRRAVANTNARYGGDAPGGTRILFPSGSVDPWIANSFTSQTFAPRWEPAFVVPGASHHARTHPPRDSDSDAVKRARAKSRRASTRGSTRVRCGRPRGRFESRLVYKIVTFNQPALCSRIKQS